MAALSYMQRRRSGTYEFRRRLPQALAGKPVPAHIRDRFPDLINVKTGCFKREFVRSLDTKEVRKAKTQDHREALKFARLVDDAMAALAPASLSSVVIDPKEIGEAVYRQLLADDEAERIMGDDRRRVEVIEYDHEAGKEVIISRADRWPNLIDVPPSSAIGTQVDHAEVYGEEVSDLVREYRDAFARRDPSIVHAETAIELKRRGAMYDKSSWEFQAVALEVLRAHVRAYEDMTKRHRGEDVPTPSPVVVASRGPRLSEAFKVWKSGGGEARGAHKPGDNTIIEAEHVVRSFTELHGDMYLTDITRGKAREFREAVAKVPTRLTAKLRKLSLPELLQRDLTGLPLRHATTINKMLQLLGAIVSKAEGEGLLDDVPNFANPFDKAVKIKVDDGDRSARAIFTKADLEAIFASPIYVDNWRTGGGGGEAAFWFPLIALFTGMRLNEIAQLRICDLKQDEDHGDIWFFDIGRSGGRKTKTKSSIRRVPVHPELVRIGLLKYRSWMIECCASLEDDLWPDVMTTGNRTKSAAWSTWINRHMHDVCGIAEDRVFHSFRHTFKRMSRDAGLNEELHDALTGHANKGSVGRSYGDGYSIKPLADAINALVPPVDLAGIVWRKP